ncbi:MFS transporter [Streptomyces sp. NPDC101733]|uniref:MFS transporter n=1 Tax=unclassified Streptomyces TaxID=2593676 RepID=UPI0037F50FAF
MRERIALAVSVGGAALVAFDGTVLFVVQPSLRRDLGASLTQVQWTSTAYLLTVAAFLVIAGRLGDRYGHSRLLAVGSLGFAAASAGVALAPDLRGVIVLRAVQGLFAALLQPATLALLRLAYPPERLAGAVAFRTAAIGVATAAGPPAGGLLAAHPGWRAVFVLNVPVAVAIGVLTLFVRAPAPSVSTRTPLGPVAPILLSGALASAVYALSGAAEYGWTAGRTLVAFGVAAGFGTLFVRGERRATRPLVPAAVARTTAVTASMGLLLAVSAGMFGALFTATFLLQDVRGLGPLATAVRVLPLTALMVVGAPVAGAALRRYGARRTASAGTVLMVLGIAGLERGGPVAFGVLGAGFAAVMVTATGTVVGDAPAGHAGVVGGLKQTAMNVGPTLGIAVAAGAGGWGSADRTLIVLAVLAALGLAAARLLPGRTPVGEVSGPAVRG